MHDQIFCKVRTRKKIQKRQATRQSQKQGYDKLLTNKKRREIEMAQQELRAKSDGTYKKQKLQKV